jgi:hypothetical protein
MPVVAQKFITQNLKVHFRMIFLQAITSHYILLHFALCMCAIDYCMNRLVDIIKNLIHTDSEVQ